MQRQIRRLAFALLGCAATAASAQTLPSDASKNCPVSPQTFASWFASGTPTVNGVVNPANSIAFQPSSNCAFYDWSQQMFLWLTSPAPANYGGNSFVFNSNVFYQVLPSQTQPGKLVLVAQPSMHPMSFNVRSAQVGPNGLQLLLDNHNVMHEIVPPKFAKDGKQLIQVAGKSVEIASASLVKGKVVLLDKAKKPIKPQLTLLAQPKGMPSMVQQIKTAGKPLFIDANGFPIIPGQGQAGGGGVLIAQNGSLVYYATFVNDVFAWYLTQVLNMNGGNTPNGTQFPTTQSDLNSIVAYAQAHGVTFPDPDALAIEVKTSWVVPDGLNASTYATVQGIIPTYTKSPTQWTATNQYVTAPLALVGMHVVGSATNHPEMIWSTFEHFGNAPSAAYTYVNTGGATITVPQNTSGSWLFCQTNCNGPFNTQLANFVSPNIVASTSAPIGPSNTMLWHAFGAAIDTSPNPIATSPVSNSDVISSNNSVGGQLLNGDLRKNYYFVGSTWTNGGVTPGNPFYGNPNPVPTPTFPPGNVIGTSQISNSTMETYQQGSSSNTFSQYGSCFQCHNKTTNAPNATVNVSHIWPNILPLFTSP
ncbi:MAG TPA: hypothetical protein VG889_03950 [Rhizomicrobium sp.]|nr:hypothetical protein [Rhizomicrobium sp.]